MANSLTNALTARRRLLRLAIRRMDKASPAVLLPLGRVALSVRPPRVFVVCAVSTPWLTATRAMPCAAGQRPWPVNRHGDFGSAAGIRQVQ